MNEQKLKKKLAFMIATVILLVCGLTATSFALANSIVTIKNNKFSMSMGVSLCVNNDEPIDVVSDILFEPGGTYVSTFPIANRGNLDMWYRVYLTDVDGALKDDIYVTIKEKTNNSELVLCNGVKMSEIDVDSVISSELVAGQEKTIAIEFYFSADADNESQSETVSFNIITDATQKDYNLDRDFGRKE